MHHIQPQNYILLIGMSRENNIFMFTSGRFDSVSDFYYICLYYKSILASGYLTMMHSFNYLKRGIMKVWKTIHVYRSQFNVQIKTDFECGNLSVDFSFFYRVKFVNHDRIRWWGFSKKNKWLILQYSDCICHCSALWSPKLY